MKSSRIKSTVIAILALVNVCLLILLVSRRAQERVSRSHTVAQLTRLYSESGVELPASLVPAEELRLAAVDPARDLSAEAAFAEALLGSCASEEVGGGIYRYVGQSGQCLLRASGAVEASLDRAVDDPEAFAEALFGAHGYALSYSGLSSGSGTVVAVRALSDATVFNAELTLTFEQNRLLSAAGFFIPPMAESAGERGGGISGVTALVRFLDYSKRSGEVCTAIIGVRGGYLLQNAASVSQRLIPAWCVGTDVSQYYVNSMTGEVTRGT